MSSKFKFLKISRDQGVATVMLERAEKMNSLSMAVRDEIEGCFDLLAAEEDTHAVILTGGEDTFVPVSILPRLLTPASKLSPTAYWNTISRYTSSPSR